MNKLKKWFWTLVYKFEYRKIDPDMCCCGAISCVGDYSHGYVNAKDYTIGLCVKTKIINQDKG